MATPHIESHKDDIAKLILMPGDPKRAEFIANNFLVGARLVNSLRGATAYTGYYKNVRVTIFPSGMGMPSIGIYSHELFKEYDVDIILRIGTAGSYEESLKVGNLFLADSAYSKTTFDEQSLNESIDYINSNLELNNIITETSSRLGLNINSGRVHTTDAFYSSDTVSSREAIKNGCRAVEMESFALFLNAREYHKKAAAIFTITDEIYSGNQMPAKDREIRLNSMITLALESITKLQ